MTFANHGTIWHVDHVLPCAKFDVLDEDEQYKCCNWTNLRPLYSNENLVKNDNICKNVIDAHEEIVKKYIREHKIKETEYMFHQYDKKKFYN